MKGLTAATGGNRGYHGDAGEKSDYGGDAGGFTVVTTGHWTVEPLPWLPRRTHCS